MLMSITGAYFQVSKKTVVRAVDVLFYRLDSSPLLEDNLSVADVVIIRYQFDRNDLGRVEPKLLHDRFRGALPLVQDD